MQETISLVVASCVVDEIVFIEQIECEHPGLLLAPIEAKGISTEIIRPYKGDKLPEALGPGQGLIVLGGPMNVDETDKYPHLAEQIRLIKETVDRGQLVLGICLGSQLLAKALGARVYSAPSEEIGWDEVEITDAGLADPIFKEIPNPLPVFQWHGETFEIARGATHLASSNACANQAFRYGSRAYGLQFHFEVNREMAQTWATAYANDEDRNNPDWQERLLSGFEDMDTVQKRCERIVHNLLRVGVT